MDKSAKQKQIYYLFSKLENSNGFEKAVYGLILDYFIDNGNNYTTLTDLSNSLVKKSIDINPERINEALSVLNREEVFVEYPKDQDILKPFKLKQQVFDDFSTTINYIDKLFVYVADFQKKEKYPTTSINSMIEILLETIFSQNIKYLKDILTLKDEKNLVLHFSSNGKSHFTDEEYRQYNNLILKSNSEFEEILRMLILKMFDFLSLNYNPKYKETLDKRFGGKIFYLDSSFIVRLFGFDGDLRQQRSLDLINILNDIKDVKFVIHTKTIEETEFKLKELIGRYSSLLDRKIKTLESILNTTDSKTSCLIKLFLNKKKEGVIANSKDFALYYSNVKKILKDLLKQSSLEFDSASLYNSNSKRNELAKQLKNNTFKSKNRIKHIVKILDYVEKLRGANNYNPFEIKYWLITTDQKTLELDTPKVEYEIDGIEEIESKSICIMPSELIRFIDGSGDIKGEHVSVFKQYMLKSHVFQKQYSDDEIKIIAKIATIVEDTDVANYDVETMIDNLFKSYTLEEIQKRIEKQKDQKDKDKELVEIFLETNDDYIDTKLSRVLDKISRNTKITANVLWYTGLFIVPTLFYAYVAIRVVNWTGFNLLNPETWIVKDVWDSISTAIAIFGTLVLGTCIWVTKKFREMTVAWFVKKRIESYYN